MLPVSCNAFWRLAEDRPFTCMESVKPPLRIGRPDRGSSSGCTRTAGEPTRSSAGSRLGDAGEVGTAPAKSSRE